MKGVIVENSFSSLDKVVNEHIPFYLSPFKSMAEWFSSEKWDSVEAVRKVQCPILFINSAEDTLVSKASRSVLHSEADKARKSTIHLNIAGANHSNAHCVDKTHYFSEVKSFINM